MKNLIYLVIVLLISHQAVLGVENQESRIALLIGNQNYQKGRLDNPHNDVDDMETALENDIFLKLKTNGDYNLDITYKKFSNTSKIINYAIHHFTGN